ncbi:hypothetical protein [Streptomyces sp. NPDC056411]|uniref:hypothetical protein n=1 Tax=Streptomyces sp. NPDC056411 TaxID=3345813 RepID=UPI0035D6198E
MVPDGQHMANLRRTGGLGKNAERAEERAQQLTAIDPHWNCPWPLNWQRHYRVLADLVNADGVLPYISPASPSRATTWASGGGGSRSRAPGHSCRKSSASGCPRWTWDPLKPRLPPRRPHP